MSRKSDIEKIISESTDMITALESVGAMYCIPSTHMLVGDTGAKSLRVVEDHIITPPDVKPNTKAIVCAIGGVLDHISQRIDEKLNHYQNDNIQKGRIDEHIKTDANPSKGRVISRYVDDNGDEILVYDSGLVDMASTKEAIAKVSQLRHDMKIPNPTLVKSIKRSTYFNDEDDISVPEPRPERLNPDTDKIDMEEITSESATLIDMIAHFNDTTHLGYDWLQEDGFDFVKPTDMMIQETDEDQDVQHTKPASKPNDVKYMKFDNTHIIKAIGYFNKAREEQGDKENGHWDVSAFINSDNYKKAINELEKQFDCKLNVRFFNDNAQHNNLSTPIMNNIKQNFHISKSKGFQLHGTPIDIFIMNKALDEEMSKDTNKKLFGQFVCAGLCHEIFHNIISVIRHNNYTFTYSLMSAMSLASSAPNAKSRRIAFEKYVDTLEAAGIKLSNSQRKKLIKDLCYISTSNDETLLNKLKNRLEKVDTISDADKEMMQYIKALEKVNETYTKLEKKSQKARKHKGFFKTVHVIGAILTCTGIGALAGIPMMTTGSDPLKYHDKYLNSKNKEEFYCDLFAGIYQLPLTFLVGFKKRSFTVNQISEARLDKIANLEKRVMMFAQSTYPTLSERNYAAMTIAKNILENNTDIDPAIKEYCEWIVSNYSNILTTNIGNNYNSVTFNPEEAKDLDKHIQSLIDHNDITVTESVI